MQIFILAETISTHSDLTAYFGVSDGGQTEKEITTQKRGPSHRILDSLELHPGTKLLPGDLTDISNSPCLHQTGRETH
ncbi:Ryanodine Receptor 3 [Manis pentadactyla]|nr:Ryanodine Receptor 3 [Manis pentadactyla]